LGKMNFERYLKVCKKSCVGRGGASKRDGGTGQTIPLVGFRHRRGETKGSTGKKKLGKS